MIRLTLACVPPNTTAQQKRVRMTRRGPRFFHSATMQRETATWQALLVPHRPPEPIAGPVRVTVVGIWPHTAGTPKRDRAKLLPKTSKPDASNYAKHLEDLLVTMRFLAEDSRVTRLVVEKWRGPAEAVGIRLELAPVLAEDQPCL